MLNLSIVPEPGAVPSPLWICDRLITMAQQADRAGYPAAADALVRLAVALPENRSIRPPRRRRDAG